MIRDSRKKFFDGSTGKTVPGLGVEMVTYHLGREEYCKRKANAKPNPDTEERMSIFREIHKLLDYGLSKNETLQRVTEKFQDSKYTDFFKSWVEDQYNKRIRQLVNKQKKHESDVDREK